MVHATKECCGGGSKSIKFKMTMMLFLDLKTWASLGEILPD